MGVARRRRLFTVVWIAAATLLVVGAVAFTVQRYSKTHAPVTARVVHTSWRTVAVAGSVVPQTPAVLSRACGASSDCQNGKDGILVVHLLQGPLPSHRVQGLVLTDTSCTPDAYGISHCHNEIRLDDGTTILVQHDHNMQVYPCLKPGEPVWVGSAASL